MRQPLLTIAIPTFNRATKLQRLLSVVQEEIATSDLAANVRIMVSDNASVDRTPAVVLESTRSDSNLAYFRQPKNLGFDSNLSFLYSHANTPYVWFLADDDFPLKGAISKLVSVIETHEPDVLLFSFVHSPSSAARQFSSDEPVEIVRDPVSAIAHLLRYPKISIFVVRKLDFSDYQHQVLDDNLGTGWRHISLAFSVLNASRTPRLALVSESLAGCDEECPSLSWAPTPFLEMHKLMRHPFVQKHRPDLSRIYREEGYYQAIQFAFAVKSGGLLSEYPQEYDEFIAKLEFRGATLLRNPRSLLQFIALKLGVARLWPKIRRRVKPLARFSADR